MPKISGLAAKGWLAAIAFQISGGDGELTVDERPGANATSSDSHKAMTAAGTAPTRTLRRQPCVATWLYARARVSPLRTSTSFQSRGVLSNGGTASSNFFAMDGDQTTVKPPRVAPATGGAPG